MSEFNQTFNTFDEWVSKASSWLTNHPRYNEGADWVDPNPFRAICFDSAGNQLRNGGDFAEARDKDLFPVRWIWPDQVGSAVLTGSKCPNVAPDERERLEYMSKYARGLSEACLTAVITGLKGREHTSSIVAEDQIYKALADLIAVGKLLYRAGDIGDVLVTPARAQKIKNRMSHQPEVYPRDRDD